MVDEERKKVKVSKMLLKANSHSRNLIRRTTLRNAKSCSFHSRYCYWMFANWIHLISARMVTETPAENTASQVTGFNFRRDNAVKDKLVNNKEFETLVLQD